MHHWIKCEMLFGTPNNKFNNFHLKNVDALWETSIIFSFSIQNLEVPSSPFIWIWWLKQLLFKTHFLPLHDDCDVCLEERCFIKTNRVHNALKFLLFDVICCKSLIAQCQTCQKWSCALKFPKHDHYINFHGDGHLIGMNKCFERRARRNMCIGFCTCVCNNHFCLLRPRKKCLHLNHCLQRGVQQPI